MFYDREKEMQMLWERYKNLKRGELLVIYGRRRVGKTFLAREFLKKVENGVYTYIDYCGAGEILARISKDFSMQTNTFLRFGDWDDLYDYLSSFKGKMVVVFDEFQRLNTTAPESITRLQHHWDSVLKDKSIMVILTGSSIGMMRKVAVEGGAPLYGRATMIYKLRPFDYIEMRRMFPDRTEEERIRIYTIFGGTPHYLSMYKNRNAGLLDGIWQLVLEDGAPLREEPLTLLRTELKEITRYNSILSSIARGKQTLTELSHGTGIEVTKLRYYIENLIELLDIVEVRAPLLGKKKTTRYVIKDNFFNFWYRHIFPNRSRLEIGNQEPVLKEIERNIQSDMGFVFEDIVREFLIHLNHKEVKGHPLNIDGIGSWWNRKGDEIDIAAINSDELLLGEIKWGKMDMPVIERLIEKSTLVNWKGNKQFMAVSGKGFTKRCLRYMEEKKVIHLDLEEISEMLHRSQ